MFRFLDDNSEWHLNNLKAYPHFGVNQIYILANLLEISQYLTFRVLKQ